MNGDPEKIEKIARTLGLDESDVEPVGRGKAKVSLSALERERRGLGRMILVSAITPTPSGEGKTTVSVGLSMALARLGRRSALCLRQPSLGPVFGMKGGGTGGGRSTVIPADDINLHFTGDLHAVSSAHNLLAALADNDVHFGGLLDPRRITWPRVVDMNDRALRRIVIGLGGPNDGVPREAGFDVTAASEVMAVLCLAGSDAELKTRVGRIIVGRKRSGEAVTAEDLGATGAMHALLRSALEPNLVQTVEGTPAFVHGGPFANIAHGTSSIVSMKLAMHYADDVIVEAGFGFDLGGEKFLHLACPAADVWPSCVVLVTTVQALAHHGGGTSKDSAGALERGLVQIEHHVGSVRAFGLEPIVAINVFADDDELQLAAIERYCDSRSIAVARIAAYSQGGAGGEQLARRVSEVLEAPRNAAGRRALYAPEDSLPRKLEVIARRMYGARGVVVTPDARRDLDRFSSWGFGALPPCIAKTPLSLSDDPSRSGKPTDFDITVEQFRLSAGAGFIVALCGAVRTMPGLPHDPAAKRIYVGSDGRIVGIVRDS